VDEVPARLRFGRDDKVETPQIIIYTDGSKFGESAEAGFGWAATSGDVVLAEGFGQLSCATVFQAELIAISEALDWLVADGKHQGDCEIRTDSQSARYALRSKSISSRLVLDILEKLERAQASHKVVISWIKGHADHTGNEFADALAKSGCTSLIVKEVPISVATLKARVHALFLEVWQKRWSTEPSCVNTRLFLPEVSEKRQRLAKLKRQELTLLCQVVTGHGLWDYHLAHWKDVNPKCSLCQGDQDGTSWHLWQECDALVAERGLIIWTEKFEPLFPDSILCFFGSTRIQRLMKRNGDLC